MSFMKILHKLYFFCSKHKICFCLHLTTMNIKDTKISCQSIYENMRKTYHILIILDMSWYQILIHSFGINNWSVIKILWMVINDFELKSTLFLCFVEYDQNPNIFYAFVIMHCWNIFVSQWSSDPPNISLYVIIVCNYRDELRNGILWLLGKKLEHLLRDFYCCNQKHNKFVNKDNFMFHYVL